MNRLTLSPFHTDVPDPTGQSQSPSQASALTSPTAGAGGGPGLLGATGGATGAGGPSKPTYAKRGKITIVACVPCRKRKTKVPLDPSPTAGSLRLLVLGH